MARDPDTIQREIEQARDALANTLDELSVRADPKKLVDHGKASVHATLDDPKVRMVLIAAGALVALVVVRKIFR